MGSKENAVQTAILQYLRTQNIVAWRQNAGAVFRGMYGNGKPRIQKYGEWDMRGKGDISGILPDGIRLEIECKSENGRQTPEQKNFEALMKQYGGVYILAKDVNKVMSELKRLHYV